MTVKNCINCLRFLSTTNHLPHPVKNLFWSINGKDPVLMDLIVGTEICENENIELELSVLNESEKSENEFPKSKPTSDVSEEKDTDNSCYPAKNRWTLIRFY